MATIPIGQVGQSGSPAEAGTTESRPDPVAQAAFARELLSRARAGQGAQNGSAAAARTRTTVPASATQLTGGQAAQSLATAWQNVFHETPSPDTLRVLVAQWSHETGGGRAMMNYNFGGIKGTSPSGMSAAYVTTEGERESAVKLTDHFRAYGSAIEGATDYVKFLSSRFSGAMVHARSGDAEGFVHALKQSGYFTGSEEDYTRSVTRLTERAKVHGYDAIGHQPSASDGVQVARAVHIENPRTIAASDLAASLTAATDAAAPTRSFQAADALAMADELCRAALRIAVSDDDRNHRG